MQHISKAWNRTGTLLLLYEWRGRDCSYHLYKYTLIIDDTSDLADTLIEVPVNSSKAITLYTVGMIATDDETSLCTGISSIPMNP